MQSSWIASIRFWVRNLWPPKEGENDKHCWWIPVESGGVTGSGGVLSIALLLSVVWEPAGSASPGSISGPTLDLTSPNLHFNKTSKWFVCILSKVSLAWSVLSYERPQSAQGLQDRLGLPKTHGSQMLIQLSTSDITNTGLTCVPVHFSLLASLTQAARASLGYQVNLGYLFSLINDPGFL